MKKNTQSYFKGVVLAILVLVPVMTFAVRTLRDLIELVIEYLGYAIPLIISLSIVVFIWGIYKHFFKPDADKKEAGNFLLFGVIGFFLMLSFWGLVNVLINTFNLQTNYVPGIPFIRSNTGGSGSNYIEFEGRSSGGGVIELEGRSTR